MSERFTPEHADGPPPTTAARPSRWRWLGVVAVGALVMAAGWLSALSPLAAPTLAVLAMLVGWTLMRSARAEGDESDEDAPQGSAGMIGLGRQVLPVWKRNVEAARAHADASMHTLVERFASVSAQLDVALSNSTGASLDLGTTDELLARHQPEVQRLLGTTKAAVAARDEVLKVAQEVAAELATLERLAREVQNISRATNLLALNAGVEATRANAGGQGVGHGFSVVAQEVRALAGQSRQTGNDMDRRVTALRERLDALVHQARRDDTDADELALQADENARAVVRALVGSLAEVSRSSRTLRDAGRQIQADIDDILVGLQAQDRLSQMLNSVTDDIGRMDAYLGGGEDEAAHSAVTWLERLDASYTMEEMRSSLHHTTNVDTGTSVEFF